MSKRSSRPSEEMIRSEYPIADLVPGWFFRVRERSANVYEVEGIALDGRRIAHTGSDQDALLARCAREAAEFDRRAQTPPGSDR